MLANERRSWWSLSLSLPDGVAPLGSLRSSLPLLPSVYPVSVSGVNLNPAAQLNRRERRKRSVNNLDSARMAQGVHLAGEACWQPKIDALPSASVHSVSSCSIQLLLLARCSEAEWPRENAKSAKREVFGRHFQRPEAFLTNPSQIVLSLRLGGLARVSLWCSG